MDVCRSDVVLIAPTGNSKIACLGSSACLFALADPVSWFDLDASAGDWGSISTSAGLVASVGGRVSDSMKTYRGRIDGVENIGGPYVLEKSAAGDVNCPLHCMPIQMLLPARVIGANNPSCPLQSVFGMGITFMSTERKL